MTGRAIRIAAQGLGRIRAGILAVGRLVLMRMVAEVLGAARFHAGNNWPLPPN